MTGSILQYERETFEEDEIDDTPHFFVEDVNPMVDTFGETSNVQEASP